MGKTSGRKIFGGRVLGTEFECVKPQWLLDKEVKMSNK